MKNSKLIIWDFDGVLVDSLRECLIVLEIGIELLKNENNFLDKERIVEKVNRNFDEKLFIKMKSLRPFVINGQDYIWQYLNLDRFSKTFNSYFEYKVEFDKIFDINKDRIYEKNFYRARKILQETLGENYYKLFSPYQGAINALKKSIRVNKNYICSARDIKAIKLIFNLNDINLNERFIYAKGEENNGAKSRFSKIDHMKFILKKEIPLNKKYIIIEDQLTLPLNLLNKFSKLKIIYAKYGYGIDEELVEFEKRSIQPIHKDDEIMDLVLS